MFCDKSHVNQLTAILFGQGFRDIVVCPGSRNGILVHNFDAAHFRLHPVTDERSAAFVALGLCLSTRQPVALCVTSGSALLNTMPGVAEASFRHLPILIISADRPKQWIGQLDGQTLSQNNALLPYAPTFTLEEPANKEEEHWNELRMNEAILSLKHHGGQPVHINVSITEPLFTFNTERLPNVNIISEENPEPENPISENVIHKIENAQFPIIVIGQYEHGNIRAVEEINQKGTLLVLPELISCQKYSWRTTALEHLLPNCDFTPDLVIHIGGNLVNKQLKLHLRRISDCEVIRIEPSDNTPDTFGHLHTIIRCNPENALRQLAGISKEKQEVRQYQHILDCYQDAGREYIPTCFSDISVMQQLSRALPAECALQIANSSVIRNATYFMDNNTRQLFCNRGVNGIEGSLSAAVGYALGHHELTLALIGDLSFFYDQNALWNTQLPSNLRILLFNNGGGQIFYRLSGLNQTPALAPYIAASHTAQACGIAQSYGLTYLEAHNGQESTKAINSLLQNTGEKPVLLEIHTHTADNELELKRIKQYYKTLKDYGKNLE